MDLWFYLQAFKHWMFYFGIKIQYFLYTVGEFYCATLCDTQGHSFDLCLHRENVESGTSVTESPLTALACQCCCIVALLFIKASGTDGSLLSTVCKKNHSLKSGWSNPEHNFQPFNCCKTSKLIPGKKKAHRTWSCKVLWQLKLTVNCPTHPHFVSSRIVLSLFLLPLMFLKRQEKVAVEEKGEIKHSSCVL